MPATLSAELKSEPKTPETAREPRRRPRRKAPPRRWVREVQGIAAMTAAVCHVLFKTWLNVQLPSGP